MTSPILGFELAVCGELAPMVIHQWRFFLDFRNLRLSLISKNAMRKSTNIPSFRRLLDPRNPFTEAPRSTPQYTARGFRKRLKVILPTALRIYGSRRIKKHEYKNPTILVGFFGEWIFTSSFASKRAKLARNLNTVRFETGAKIGQ